MSASRSNIKVSKEDMGHRGLHLGCSKANYWGKNFLMFRLPPVLCSNCKHFWFECPDLPCQIRSVCSSSTMGNSLRPSRPGSQRPLLSCAVAEDIMMSFVTAEDL